MRPNKFPEFLKVIRAFEETNKAEFKIYMLTCRLIGQSYIGCSRKLYHSLMALNVHSYDQSQTTVLNRTILQYGLSSFDLTILDADVDEKYARKTLLPSYISLHNTFRNGLNETHGGRGPVGYTMPSQAKKLLRLNALRQKYTPPVSTGTKWINNGVINKRLLKDQELPAGFALGRVLPLQRKAA